MIKFKVCPRCRGDLYLSEDTFGKYFSCLQCGYLRDVEQPRSYIHQPPEFNEQLEAELDKVAALAEETVA